MGSVAHGGGNAKDASEVENESLSVSEHLDVVSGGGEDGNPRKRKKRYHRHTPQQIQQLEA